MTRFLLRLVTIASGVLAVAFLVAGVRSYWRNDSVFLERGAHGYFVASARGRVGVVQIGGPRVGGQWHPHRAHWATYDLRTTPAVLVAISKSPDTKDLYVMLSGDGRLPSLGQARWFAVHYAVPVIAFGLLPTIVATRAIRHRRRTTRGLCLACGYDIRATPERCPECGATAAASPATAT